MRSRPSPCHHTDIRALTLLHSLRQRLTTTTKSIEYHGLTMDDRGLLHTTSADVTSTSIDSRPTPSIDSRNNPSILEGVYYLLRDGVDFLTTRLDVLQQEMVMIQRQLDSQAEPSPSIYRRTHPSIDGDYTTRRSKLVTEKSLQDKLDEITFSQDFLKEDVYQELKNISETTYARF
ncbi:hypothetical protein YC2023_094239 [Brassica napus]